jgi:hypothetical protein
VKQELFTGIQHDVQTMVVSFNTDTGEAETAYSERRTCFWNNPHQERLKSTNIWKQKNEVFVGNKNQEPKQCSQNLANKSFKIPNV